MDDWVRFVFNVPLGVYALFANAITFKLQKVGTKSSELKHVTSQLSHMTSELATKQDELQGIESQLESLKVSLDVNVRTHPPHKLSVGQLVFSTNYCDNNWSSTNSFFHKISWRYKFNKLHFKQLYKESVT